MSKLYFTVGIPGSGKSHWSEDNKERLNAVVHSSDEIRAELTNINDQSQNELVFNTLHKRVKEDLLNGKNVIYDATNLNRRRRINFLSNELRDISCEKICILFATPFEFCKANNSNRERKVPEHVLEKMIRNFEVPCKQEGWDDIQIVWFDYNKHCLKFDYVKDLKKWCNISHNNPHHTLSIGDHMIAALNHYEDMCYEDPDILDDFLSLAIFMHDCGKVHVKSFLDKDGNVTLDRARYYEHHNVGAYLSLFYLKDMSNFTNDEILGISLLINCHMRHFMTYKDSDKARERDRKLFGDLFMEQLDILHECDLAAH